MAFTSEVSGKRIVDEGSGEGEGKSVSGYISHRFNPKVKRSGLYSVCAPRPGTTKCRIGHSNIENTKIPLDCTSHERTSSHGRSVRLTHASGCTVVFLPRGRIFPGGQNGYLGPYFALGLYRCSVCPRWSAFQCRAIEWIVLLNSRNEAYESLTCQSDLLSVSNENKIACSFACSLR